MPERERDSGGDAEGGRGVVSRWEWVVGAVGLVLVLGSIAFLIFEAFTTDGTPPDLRAGVDSVAARAGAYVVHVTVRNQGGTTAAAVHVEGVAWPGAGPPETGEAVIDYVPARGRRSAGLMFTRDPRGRPVQVRVKGYDLP